MQLQNIQDHPFDTKERTLVKVLAAGLLLVFRDKRAAICHTYSMSIHKFLYLFQKVLVTCFNKVVSPFVFSLFEQIAGNLLFSTSHEIPYTSRYFKQLASTPLHLYAPLFPSGHPSVTNSRFEVSSRWVDGPMWWLSEDMHHVLGFITTIQPWPSKRLMCQVPTGGFILLIDVVYRQSQIFPKVCHWPGFSGTSQYDRLFRCLVSSWNQAIRIPCFLGL